MSPAVANDGVSSIMALLAVLLAMMLFAVIRAPGRAACRRGAGGNRTSTKVQVESCLGGLA